MNSSAQPTEVRLGRQGRFAIPVRLRKSLGFEEGDRLVARADNGRLVLEKQETIAQRLKSRFAKLPENRSLADESIAARREAARQEASE